MGELKPYPQIGYFVETLYGTEGILLTVKPSPYGAMAFIGTADERVVRCPLYDLRRKDNGIKI